MIQLTGRIPITRHRKRIPSAIPLTRRGDRVDSAGSAGIMPASTDGAAPVRSVLSIKRRIMFAVIRTGGKQYKVAKDDVITVEKLPGEPGATVTLDDVLMLGDGASATTGTPRLAGASVTAEVVEQMRSDKVLVFKKRRRHNYRRKNGHRQALTVLKVIGISAGE